MASEQKFWNCVNDVSDLFVCTSADETFDNVWGQKWHTFEQKLRDVVMNRFIMQRAIHFFNENNLQKNDNDLTKLRSHIKQTCKELELDHKEWMYEGWRHVINKC